MKTNLLVFLTFPIVLALAGPTYDSTSTPLEVTEIQTSTSTVEPRTAENNKSGKLNQEENKRLQEFCGKFEEIPIAQNFSRDGGSRNGAPWAVTVLNTKFGGNHGFATLISSRHVLTARHIYEDSVETPRFQFVNQCGTSMQRAENCSEELLIVRKAIKAFTPKEDHFGYGTMDLRIFELDEPVPIGADLYPACLADYIPPINDVLDLLGVPDESSSSEGKVQILNFTVTPCVEYDKHQEAIFCTSSNYRLDNYRDAGLFAAGKSNQEMIFGVLSSYWSMADDLNVNVQTAVAPHLSWICEHTGICVDTKTPQIHPVIKVIEE